MKRERAVVIGGGFSGLIAARILADHFNSVLILDKDERIGSNLPRVGVAQGSHLHVLLKRGQEILQNLFPEIEVRFQQALCPKIDWAADTQWVTKAGGFPRYPSAIQTYSFSRPFLESAIYSFVAQRPNISIESAHVEELIHQKGLVTSVRCLNGPAYSADLVVLAGGQHLPIRRLTGLAEIESKTQSLPIHITYRSLTFELDSLDLRDCKQYYYQLAPPQETLGAVICPIEGHKAIATIVQYGVTQTNRMQIDDYIELAKKVPGGKFYEILKNGVPCSAVSIFHKPFMSLRRLDKVSEFPSNLFAMGDVFCSLNPVFGQGMTTILEQALLLNEVLKSKSPHSRAFHRRSVARVRLPFLLSKFGSSVEEGFIKRYLQSFTARCQTSPHLHKKFLNVLHLKSSYGSLLDPHSIGSSLLRHGGPRRG